MAAIRAHVDTRFYENLPGLVWFSGPGKDTTMDSKFPNQLFPHFYLDGPPEVKSRHSYGGWGSYERVLAVNVRRAHHNNDNDRSVLIVEIMVRDAQNSMHMCLAQPLTSKHIFNNAFEALVHFFFILKCDHWPQNQSQSLVLTLYIINKLSIEKTIILTHTLYCWLLL